MKRLDLVQAAKDNKMKMSTSGNPVAHPLVFLAMLYLLHSFFISVLYTRLWS